MPLTRRQFGLVTTSVALTVLGGDQTHASPQPAPQQAGEKPNRNRANLATEPFRIGPPEKYKDAKLYADFKADKGVWLISDGKTLVALSATCTHNACTTHFKEDAREFACPCHESRFGLDGGNLGGKAKRPLERCALRLISSDGTADIEVDPTRRFRKDKDQWSDPASSLTL